MYCSVFALGFGRAEKKKNKIEKFDEFLGDNKIERAEKWQKKKNSLTVTIEQETRLTIFAKSPLPSPRRLQ